MYSFEQDIAQYWRLASRESWISPIFVIFRFSLNFRRTKNIFILSRFKKFWMFWKAMSLNRSFLGSMVPGDRPYRHPQRQTWGDFRQNLDWPTRRCAPPLSWWLDTLLMWRDYDLLVDTQKHAESRDLNELVVSEKNLEQKYWFSKKLEHFKVI